jgi:uncharacterized protein YlxW (UPF0749 family)
MSDDPIDRRDYGRMEAQVEQLTKDVHALKETVEVMRDMMQQAQGGWRAIAMLSGVAGIVGAGVTWVATHIKFS